MVDSLEEKRAAARNEDPITGEAGSHPIGVSLGTAAGGFAAGLAAGAAAGPVGAVAGAVIGGIIGAAAGKGIAEMIDPTEEDAYWSENYASRSYIPTTETNYESYRPAYRYGVDSLNRHQDRAFTDVETDLSSGWDQARGESVLPWTDARPAVKDAYDRAYSLRQERLRNRNTAGSSTTNVPEDAF